METIDLFSGFFDEGSNNQHLFEKKGFTVTFDQFNVSLLIKSIKLEKYNNNNNNNNNLLNPRLLKTALHLLTIYLLSWYTAGANLRTVLIAISIQLQWMGTEALEL